jgi:hypothetical protein
MTDIPEIAAAVLAADLILGDSDPLEGDVSPPMDPEPTPNETRTLWRRVEGLIFSWGTEDTQWADNRTGRAHLGIYAERVVEVNEDGAMIPGTETDTGRYEVRAWGPWDGTRYPDFDNPPILLRYDPEYYCDSIDDAVSKATDFVQVAEADLEPSTPSGPSPPPISPETPTPGFGGPLASAGAGAGAQGARGSAEEVDFVQIPVEGAVTRDLSGVDIQSLKDAGRHGDTDLVHVNEEEKAMLKAAGGSGTTNPRTGLKEYYTGYQPDGSWVIEEETYAGGAGTGNLAWQIITTPTDPREYWILKVYNRDGSQAWTKRFEADDDLNVPIMVRMEADAWMDADADQQERIIEAYQYLEYEPGDADLDPDERRQVYEGTIVDDATNVYGDVPDDTPGEFEYVQYTTNLGAILDGDQPDSPFEVLEYSGSRNGNTITTNANLNFLTGSQEHRFFCQVKTGYRVIWEVNFDYQNGVPDGFNEQEQDIDETFTVYMESGDTMTFDFNTLREGPTAGTVSLILDGQERFGPLDSYTMIAPTIEVRCTFEGGYKLVEVYDPEKEQELPDVTTDPDPNPSDDNGDADDDDEGDDDDDDDSGFVLGIVLVGAIVFGTMWLLMGRGVNE